MKNSVLGISLLRHLASQGLRIFSTEQAQAAALEIEMNPSYVSEALHHMKNGGWVTRLKRGVYAIAAHGPAPHEFAVAMALVTPSTISHWTAMHYHHITEQTPQKIFATTPHGTSIPGSLWSMMACGFISYLRHSFRWQRHWHSQIYTNGRPGLPYSIFNTFPKWLCCLKSSTRKSCKIIAIGL